MGTFDVVYSNALSEIEKISNDINTDLGISIDFDQIEKCESSLDVADYCFVFLFGFIGATISTNEKLAEYLADIHKAASEADGTYDKFQILMGKLLHHKGDHIDKMVKRDGTPTNIGFHRLLWGHDIFSIGKDNPFSLMINQKGSKLGGILQALRHLIADTMSKQGLPAPGTSAFDYINENEKTSNYIIDLANNLSIETFDNKSMAQEIYSHLFTIRAQDIAGGAIAKLLTEVYFRVRKIDDKLRKSQIQFMAYAINFFAEAVIGAAKQKGVPYINIPVGTAMLVSFAKFCYFDSKETRQLAKKTNALTITTDELIERYDYRLSLVSHYNSSEEMLDALEQSDLNMDSLINFLKEEDE